MKRRQLLGAAPGLVVAASLGGCERRPPSREEVLHELVLKSVVPDTAELERSSRALSHDVESLEQAPSAAALEAARSSLRAALLAWKRAACFGLGPLVETNALVRAAFWPVRTAPLEQLLAGSSPIDDRVVAELGVDLKGLYCLEALLFPPGDARTPPLDVPAAARRRALAAAVARSVREHASRVKQALGDGEAFAWSFAAGGHASLSRVVERVILGAEHVVSQRLSLVAGLAESGLLKPSHVEGAPSGTSHDIALAELVATERLYRFAPGRGLESLVAATAPALRERLDERFVQAVSRVRALGIPLERAAVSKRDALAEAAASVKSLELALKLDLTTALGVTITFASTDGD